MHREDLERNPTKEREKSSNKAAGYAVAGCGMIRVSPDMLRSVRLLCASVGREREKLILFRKRKMLCCAIGSRKQSVCPTVSIEVSGPGSFTMTETNLMASSEAASLFRKIQLCFFYEHFQPADPFVFCLYTQNKGHFSNGGKEDDAGFHHDGCVSLITLKGSFTQR